MISRTAMVSFPRGVLYSLTNKGRQIVEIISLLEPWAKAAEETDTPVNN